MCGAWAQQRFLASLACASPGAAHEAAPPVGFHRVGNVGLGGRCGTIIDLYEVECPEGIYRVFMDLYHCAPGEDMHGR